MNYKSISKKIREKIILMHHNAHASHIGSSLSCVDLLVALYFSVLQVDPKSPYSDERDRFILSKGHGTSALYAVLAERGFFPGKILKKYCIDGCILPGHSTKHCIPGIESSTGSLGHGLPIGAGMAFGAKLGKKKHRVFVIISDGECQEGSIWETAMFSAHHKLDNLTVIIDYNKIQAFGYVKDVLNLEPLENKWKSFGWRVEEIDGHNIELIIKTLKRTPFSRGKPSLVIAHTIKGKGVSFMENNLEWHYKSPDLAEMQLALSELKYKK